MTSKPSASGSPETARGERPETSISPEFDLSNPLGSMFAVIKAVIFSPRSFFLGFDPQGDIKAPTVFVLLVSAITAVLSVVVNLVGVSFVASLGAAEVGLTAVQAVGFVVLSPVAVLVAAAVYLLSIRTFIGPVTDLKSVYRMACYAYAPVIFGWIPVLNAFAVTFALLVVMGVGIRFVFRTSFMTAFITALVSFVPLEIALIWLRVAAAGMFSG